MEDIIAKKKLGTEKWGPGNATSKESNGNGGRKNPKAQREIMKDIGVHQTTDGFK